MQSKDQWYDGLPEWFQIGFGCSVLLGMALFVVIVAVDVVRGIVAPDSGYSSSVAVAVTASPTATPQIGSPVDGVHTIGRPSVGDAWPCPLTKAKYDAMMTALVKSDNEGYHEAADDGVALTSGTHVRIIDSEGMLGTAVRLRILDGPDRGEACWAASDTSGFLQ